MKSFPKIKKTTEIALFLPWRTTFCGLKQTRNPAREFLILQVGRHIILVVLYQLPRQWQVQLRTVENDLKLASSSLDKTANI